jgi:hypothetical protein
MGAFCVLSNCGAGGSGAGSIPKTIRDHGSRNASLLKRFISANLWLEVHGGWLLAEDDGWQDSGESKSDELHFRIYDFGSMKDICLGEFICFEDLWIFGVRCLNWILLYLRTSIQFLYFDLSAVNRPSFLCLVLRYLQSNPQPRKAVACGRSSRIALEMIPFSSTDNGDTS